MCVALQLKHYYDPEALCGEELELNVQEIAALDPQGATSPIEIEADVPDMNAEEMVKKGFNMVRSILQHCYRKGWQIITLWAGPGVEEGTWEPFSALVLPERGQNPVPVDYLPLNNLGELLRLPVTLTLQKKLKD